MHYKTIVKMRYFKKNLLKFSNGHIHSILRPILKPWVPFYSLELEEFKNLFIVSVFQCFRSKRAFVCAWLKSQIFGVLGEENNFILEYATIFNK